MSPANPPVTRVERSCIVLLVLAGVWLRFDHLDAIHVEHFDEGVYASNIWFGSESGGRYPFQQLYAPPLFPWLTEWSISVLGPTSLGCMFWSLVFGSATIPAIWWLGRRWFGPAAGLVAAALVAGSEFHIVFSRAALTDATLTFWLTVATWLCWEAVERISWRWSIAGGIATGVAWSTKYSGWLPLAISLSAILAFLLVQPKLARPLTVRRLAIWCVITVTAVVVWSPVWWGLQESGGYASVAENHRGYLVGFEGWWDSAFKQATSFREFETLEFVYRLVFVTIGYAVVVRFTWNDHDGSELPSPNDWLRPWMVTVAFLLLWLLSAGLPIAACSLFGVGLWIARRLFEHRREDESSTAIAATESSLAFWFAASWFCGLLLTTPFYRPYPRLLLPWLGSCWLLTGWCGRQLLGHPKLRDYCEHHRSDAIPKIGLCLFLVTLCLMTPIPGARTYDRLAATELANTISDLCDTQSVILVHGEPATFFHLRANGMTAAPIASLNQARHVAGRSIYVFTSADSLAAADRDDRDRFTLMKRLLSDQSFLAKSDSNSENMRRPHPRALLLLRVNR